MADEKQQQLCYFGVLAATDRILLGYQSLEDTLLFARREDRVANGNSYAKATDFCELFTREMNRFYFLALLLTGDANQAERCFVAALESSQSGNVFVDWAPRWAIHNIIKEAIRIVAPALTALELQPPRAHWKGTPQQTMVPMIAGLAPLDRFVYVMTVLENYSDRECASFIGCAHSEVAPARNRAVRQLATMAEGLAEECKMRASA